MFLETLILRSRVSHVFALLDDSVFVVFALGLFFRLDRDNSAPEVVGEAERSRTLGALLNKVSLLTH